jgi:hypothetical protein
MTKRRRDWWFKRQEESWRLEIRMRWSDWKSNACDRLTSGRHFRRHLQFDPAVDTVPYRRCRLCKTTFYEPATIDVRGTMMTSGTAEQMGYAWLRQMEAIDDTLPRVRVYFSNARQEVESVNVWAMDDEQSTRFVSQDD